MKRKQLFLMGIKDGVPIGLGYFAVAFSLGITAFRAGFNFFQGFLSSALLNASAGEYALFNCVISASILSELILIMIVANARYLLMSCVLSQRLNPNMKFIHRFFMSFFITDEFFSMSISRNKYAEPFYMYGMIAFASPCWAVGTMLGVLIGQILPNVLVYSLGVSLYGMFLASIIPVSKENKVVAITVAVSFILSYVMSVISWFDVISENMRIIILTIIISAVVAVLFPKKQEDYEEQSNEDRNEQVAK